MYHFFKWYYLKNAIIKKKTVINNHGNIHCQIHGKKSSHSIPIINMHLYFNNNNRFNYKKTYVYIKSLISLASSICL